MVVKILRKPLLYPTELRGHADYDIERGRGSLEAELTRLVATPDQLGILASVTSSKAGF